MVKMVSGLGLLALIAGGAFVATAACAPSPTPADGPGPAPVRPPRIQSQNVTGVFDSNCANCHGANAEGGGGGTLSLVTKDKFDQKWDKPFFDAIRNGVPNMGMEKFGETLSEEMCWALVVHIRELQAKGLRQKFGGPKPDAGGVYRSTRQNYRIETYVAEDPQIKTPWAIDWLPDGTMLVTNRPGTIVVVKNGRVTGQVTGIPRAIELGQGGMLDVAVHPDYAQNGWVYLSFTDPKADGSRGGFTKIVRGKLRLSGGGAEWHSQQTVFEVAQEHYNGSGVHFGSRIVFDGKGHVFFCIGERGNENRAQDPAMPNGKVYRLNEDGTVPSDNPFVNTPNAIKAVWTRGHRNPQGLAFSMDGQLYDTEQHPRGGDEFNRIVKGTNYGWPTVTAGINYNDSPKALPWPKPGQDIKTPIFRWLPSNAACGLDVLRSGPLKGWIGDFFAGGLAGNSVDRIRVKGDTFVEKEEVMWGMGRCREVTAGPDGAIYVALNQPDKIVRIVAAN